MKEFLEDFSVGFITIGVIALVVYLLVLYIKFVRWVVNSPISTYLAVIVGLLLVIICIREFGKYIRNLIEDSKEN